MSIKDHVHGKVAQDCDHPACKAAVTRCRKTYELRKLEGRSPYVDIEPVRLHIATLMGRGWSLRSIAGASGVGAGSISNVSRGLKPRMRAENAQAILAVDPHQVPSKPSDGTTEPFVPRVSVVRRLQALLTLGWTHQHMRAACGLNTAALLSQQGTWVTRSTHDRVAAMYRELCNKQGPSERTRRRAAKRGYPGPLDWDDIDLDDTPDTTTEISIENDYLDESAVLRRLEGDQSVNLTTAERHEVVRRLHARGLTDYDIAAQAGFARTKVREERKAMGLPINTRHDVHPVSSEHFTTRGAQRRRAAVDEEPAA